VCGDVAMGGVPRRQSPLKNDQLGGLVPYSRALGDSQRQSPLCAHINQVRLHEGIPLQEILDLIQGRDAHGSCRAVFVEQPEIRFKHLVHVVFGQHSAHSSTTLGTFSEAHRPRRVSRRRARPTTMATVADCAQKRQDLKRSMRRMMRCGDASRRVPPFPVSGRTDVLGMCPDGPATDAGICRERCRQRLACHVAGSPIQYAHSGSCEL